MGYKKYQPSIELKPYVDFYYIWEKDEVLISPMEISSSANNYCVMLFNYGDHYCLYNRLYNGEFLPPNFLAGQSASPFRLELFGKVQMLGIVFKGTAFQDIFKIPDLRNILDERIDLEIIIGEKARQINEQLCEAENNQKRVGIIEQFLLTQINYSRPIPHFIDLAVDIILEQKGMVRMDCLASHLNLSPRQFRRAFTNRVGIGPKYFARIKRFNFVNLCLSKNPDLKWMEFVDDGAYFDQSHLIKDYQEFSGNTPNFILKRNNSYQQEIIKTGNQILAPTES